MATFFEAWLVGEDPEHLAAVGESALDEIARVERLLSRHDPSAELARVNREAAGGPVRVDLEMFAILVDCLGWYERTEGAFDVGCVLSGEPTGAPSRPLPERLALSPDRCTVRFLDDGLVLDLGGYGKGYALDSAARLFAEFGVHSALIHGGTSSVLARGTQENHLPWRVGVADPFTDDAREVTWVDLMDRGFSTSAALDRDADQSDIVDPSTGARLRRQAGCVVIASKALDAEVLSTALLAMGESRATSYLLHQDGRLPPGLSVAWIRQFEEQPQLRWIRGG